MIDSVDKDIEIIFVNQIYQSTKYIKIDGINKYRKYKKVQI